MKQMMIDVETFGNGPNGPPVQLGLAIFDDQASSAESCVSAAYQWNINLVTVLLAGGEVEEKTVQWWRDRPAEARAGIIGEGRHIGEVLEQVADIYTRSGCVRVWSHGLPYDVAMLNGYFHRLGLKVPWSYSTPRDTRTLFEEAEDLGWTRPVREVAHQGMQDAKDQALDVWAAKQFLREQAAAYSKAVGTLVGIDPGAPEGDRSVFTSTGPIPPGELLAIRDRVAELERQVAILKGDLRHRRS